MRGEYDFSGAVRGKYYSRFQSGVKVRIMGKDRKMTDSNQDVFEACSRLKGYNEYMEYLRQLRDRHGGFLSREEVVFRAKHDKKMNALWRDMEPIEHGLIDNLQLGARVEREDMIPLDIAKLIQQKMESIDKNPESREVFEVVLKRSDGRERTLLVTRNWRKCMRTPSDIDCERCGRFLPSGSMARVFDVEPEIFGKIRVWVCPNCGEFEDSTLEPSITRPKQHEEIGLPRFVVTLGAKFGELDPKDDKGFLYAGAHALEEAAKILGVVAIEKMANMFQIVHWNGATEEYTEQEIMARWDDVLEYKKGLPRTKIGNSTVLAEAPGDIKEVLSSNSVKGKTDVFGD